MIEHAYVNHILVPLDVADSFKLPLEYVRLFAERFETKVTLLYAENVPMVGPVITYPALTEEVIRELERELRAYAGDALCTIDFQTAILAGNPSFAIPIAARQFGADLIIMGTHGRRG